MCHVVSDEKPVDNGPIEPRIIDDAPVDPYPLPDGFAWCNVDMNDVSQVSSYERNKVDHDLDQS
mgnify:CR=1 FL=1